MGSNNRCTCPLKPLGLGGGGGRQSHVRIVAVAKQEEAVAVGLDLSPVAGLRRPNWRWQVVEPAGDGGAGGGTGEELRHMFAVDVDEDAADGEREEIYAQQAACVDDAEKGLAGAAARGEAARRDAAEHVGEHIVG